MNGGEAKERRKGQSWQKWSFSAKFVASNCEPWRWVNKPCADRWPPVSTLCLDPNCWALTRRGRHVPPTVPQRTCEDTVSRSQHTGMFGMFSLNALSQAAWCALQQMFYSARQQWKHANEMAKPNPGLVGSCHRRGELWLQSQHLLQKHYTAITGVCGMLCYEELEGSKFHRGGAEAFKWTERLLNCAHNF